MAKKPIVTDTEGEDFYEGETDAINAETNDGAPGVAKPEDFIPANMEAGPDPVDPPIPPTSSTPVTTAANQPYPVGNPPATPPKVPQNQLPPVEEE